MVYNEEIFNMAKKYDFKIVGTSTDIIFLVNENKLQLDHIKGLRNYLNAKEKEIKKMNRKKQN